MRFIIPLSLFLFWYPQALIIFIRAWQHSVLFLEEDMAVRLMLRLLFVPLFHDRTIFGRIMSFIFRLTRIFMGLIAFTMATILIILVALIWFLAPIVLFILLFSRVSEELLLIDLFILVIGIAVYLNQLINKPLKKLWQVKNINEVWQTSKLKKSDISWGQLIVSAEVKELLANLELTPINFGLLKINYSPEILDKAWQLGKINQAPYLTAAYFWVAMLSQIPTVERELLKLNLKLEDVYGALDFLELKRNKWRPSYLWDEDFMIRHLQGTNRGWLGAPTPNLDSASTDLTKEAARIDLPVFVGRQAVVSEVVDILSQTSDRNILLVGPPGCGKTTLAGQLAEIIVSGDAPEALATKRLISLDITKLLAAASTQGELAAKVKAVFEEVQLIENIIIFVDEIHNLGIGEAGSKSNLYSLMLPYLESNKFQFIAATEPENYARIIERVGEFARIFHKVEIPPATPAETMQSLQQEAINILKKQKITMTYLAMKTLAYLANKLIHDRVLPDSALSVLREAEVIAKDGKITSATIKQALEKRVNVPIIEVDANKRQMLLDLEKIIHERLIDQQEAVKDVSDALRRSAASLKEESRPIGSFLFVGPTGVGKTELAKTLAEVYFKNSGAYIRFDMSEYQTPDAVNRLIGFTDSPGELTEAVKNRPYALLLLDEFEKANPQILTLFLQVLEDGRLTDFAGRHIDFTNTIIIATSNIASLIIATGLGSGKNIDQIEKEVREELLKVLKPELINRFDEVVIFKPLSPQDLQKIVSLKLKALTGMLKEQGYLIEFGPQIIAELARRGFDPVLGARPLRRLIQDTLESKLSKLILENKLVKGEEFEANTDLLI